ncbi:ATP-binding protein [Streptomyces hydrogenans]|uniref:ATP-binding protein n=1 Tax=Streptomyces hydrogenans TaxID=1873719 RepID=UPI0035DCEADE
MLMPLYLGEAVPGLLEPATAVVSELVTNAVQHTPSDIIGMEVHAGPRAATIRVIDFSPEMPDLSGYDPAETDEHGRGLRIVAALAETWGAFPVMHLRRPGWGAVEFSHKCVWATLREAHR